MSDANVSLWEPSPLVAVTDAVSDPAAISNFALQLRPRERAQIVENFANGNYELVTNYVWTRTMALLKKQLGSLGNEFVGELLQRPDIDEYSDISTAMSESEAISLARDIRILTPLQAKRLLHIQSLIVHFASIDATADAYSDETMTLEDAVQCLRTCVQGVLGHENIGMATGFAVFRQRLDTETLLEDSDEVQSLAVVPYFFVRTVVSVLLTLVRTAKGAQFEHSARNAQLIIPNVWSRLKDPERWQVGNAYALEFNEGQKDSVKALNGVLRLVRGFDYVPENLRSTTFIRVASSIIAAHEGMNNFYNEPGPMRELASLGSSIPNPALAACITATLCVKLGNFYGVSHAAQGAANEVLDTISKERWHFYLDGRLEQDPRILQKLQWDKPKGRWMALLAELDIDTSALKSKKVADLVRASQGSQADKVSRIAVEMLAAT